MAQAYNLDRVDKVRICHTEKGYKQRINAVSSVWRHGGQVVSALDFRSKGRWFESGNCRRVVSLDKKLYSTLSLFTQVYKWVPAIVMLGGNLATD